MSRSGLTGSRIRERRTSLGVKQSALAQTVGISPTYLNLIEHNKRRIGGKLLVDLSRELDVDPTALTEGAEAALLEGLRDASLGNPNIDAEMNRAEELAGRFPGWSEVIAAQQRRIEALEQTAEALTDRLTHDPQLASSLHEVLSVVTAIRSTSAILADTGDVDPEWQKRFHRNLYEDSQRLAESSQALVAYLDTADEAGADRGLTLPQEEVEAWLESRAFQVEELESGVATPAEIASLPELSNLSPAGLAIAKVFLAEYAQDVAAMPLDEFSGALTETDINPAALATQFRCDLASVLRRIAAMPVERTGVATGLVQCDGSGTMTFRKSVDGFPLPRFGAACPLWPLYQALARPMSPIMQMVEQTGHTPHQFTTFAVSQPIGPVSFGFPSVYRATMLILPDQGIVKRTDGSPLPIGSSCRICPRTGCLARREPSILTDGA